jgi:hypothetical protein
MTGTTKILAAAAVALSLTAFAGQAQAQFGPMGGMMGGGGMGMRGGPMGMMRGGMGGGGPGMGSSRYMMLDGEGSRRSRSRDYQEEAPSRHAKTRGKPAPVAARAPQVVLAPAVTQGARVQTNSVSTTQQVIAVQPVHVPQTVQQVAPVAPVQQASAPESDADNALPTRVTPETRPHNCMTKLHLRDGTVILQDFCTLEQAVIKQGDTGAAVAQAPAQQTAPAAQSPYRQPPAQIARNR